MDDAIPEQEINPVEQPVEELPVAEPEVDLDALRDEKCIPVAKEILGFLATDLIPLNPNEPVNYKPLALKIIGEFFKADLVISTEVSYVPQVILGVLSGLNTTVQQCDLEPSDIARYDAIAKKILAIVFTASIRMGRDANADTHKEDFVPVKEQLNALFKEEKVTMFELKYIMDTIFSSFTALNNIVSSSIEASSARAEAKLFGVESMDELTIKKLDEVLTK